ncbi:hypothetical protein [Planktothrix sp. FACHB-1355]|nr:hypothetical protein [Planktothrix sp. FACHB-1355]
MKVFHPTFHSQAILREGFKDAENTYETGQMFKGVWVLADAPLGNNGSADGDVVLCLEIPGRLFEDYEWVEEDLECRMYRESFIPAAELNRYPIQVWNEQE